MLKRMTTIPTTTSSSIMLKPRRRKTDWREAGLMPAIIREKRKSAAGPAKNEERSVRSFATLRLRPGTHFTGVRHADEDEMADGGGGRNAGLLGCAANSNCGRRTQ